nr:probable WRKY transcription factor 31 [Tanacetum cinerariifolium]
MVPNSPPHHDGNRKVLAEMDLFITSNNNNVVVKKEDFHANDLDVHTGLDLLTRVSGDRSSAGDVDENNYANKAISFVYFKYVLMFLCPYFDGTKETSRVIFESVQGGR